MKFHVCAVDCNKPHTDCFVDLRIAPFVFDATLYDVKVYETVNCAATPFKELPLCLFWV